MNYIKEEQNYYEQKIKELIEKDEYNIRRNQRQQKEIERLNKECDTYMKIATKRGNIIDELENFIETYAIPEFNLSEEPTRYFMETKIILDKLKELKEGK